MRVIILLCLFLPVTTYACYEVEGEKVEFKGNIQKETFAGPPNYESIEKGDMPETYWVLETKAHCFKGIKEQSKFQLLVKPGVIKESGTYKVVGVTMQAISGHHHTPVLIENVKLSQP